MPLLIQIVPLEVNSPKREFVQQAKMEENSGTSSGSPHTPTSAIAGGHVVPTPPPPPVRNTNFQMTTTLGSGTIHSTTLNTFPSIQNVSSTPFSDGMSIFDSSSILTYYTLQIVGMGAWSSNSTLQGSTMGTTAQFSAIPYSGGHIPPLSPSLRGTFQQLIGLNTNSSLFNGGIIGPQSYMK
jgi:hypothetical protein